MENLLKNLEDLRERVIKTWQLLDINRKEARAHELRSAMNASDFWDNCQYFDKSPGMVANSMSGDLQVFNEVKESIDMHCNLTAKDDRMSAYFYSLANSLDAYYSKYYYATEPAP